MKLIKFRRLSSQPQILPDGTKVQYWEIAFNEEHLRVKLNGEQAEVIMPEKSWAVRLWRKFFPLKFTEGIPDGRTRTINIK